jgi:hypothetical protein
MNHLEQLQSMLDQMPKHLQGGYSVEPEINLSNELTNYTALTLKSSGGRYDTRRVLAWKAMHPSVTIFLSGEFLNPRKSSIRV